MRGATRSGLVALAIGYVLLVLGCGGAGSDGQEFHSERPPTLLTDTQEPVYAFVLGAEQIECRSGTYSAKLPEPTPSLEMSLRYQGCEFDGQPVRIETAGCAYVLEPGTSEGQVPMPIACQGDSQIRIVRGSCTLSIGSQTPEGGASFGNTHEGSERGFDVTTEARGISFDASSDSDCGFLGGRDDLGIRFAIEMFAFEDDSGTRGKPVGSWVQ